jgi:hypothetical protein
VGQILTGKVKGFALESDPCHSEEVAAATDEESAFAVKNREADSSSALRDRNDRWGDFHPADDACTLGTTCRGASISLRKMKGAATAPLS